MGLRFKVSSEKLEKPDIEPKNPGLKKLLSVIQKQGGNNVINMYVILHECFLFLLIMVMNFSSLFILFSLITSLVLNLNLTRIRTVSDDN